MNHDCRGDGVAVRKFALATRKTLAFDCTAECSSGHRGAAALLPYKQQSFVLGAACAAAAGVCGNESPRAAWAPQGIRGAKPREGQRAFKQKTSSELQGETGIDRCGTNH